MKRFVSAEPGRRSLGVVLAALLTAAGCAPTQAGAPPAKAAPPPIVVPTVVVTPYSDAELVQQFEQGRELLLTGEHKQAAAIFDRLVRLVPDGEMTAASLFNSGIAHEALGERSLAVERYQAVIDRFPDHPISKNALLRYSRVLAYVERWSDLAAAGERILLRSDLEVIDLIEAHGARALGLVAQDDLEGATRHAAIATDLIEQHRLGEAGKPPIELAQASFALGEVRRKKSERIVFTPLPPDFPDVLEQRCQGLLDAQSAYTDAMRSMDAHWSAMAGYRVGQLYQQLHRDVMQVPAPATADTPRRKQLFDGAMRLRYRILLEKGLKMMDATVRLGERTGEASPWIGRAREAKRDLERAFEDEKAALAKMPFTEKEIQAGLDSLRKKKP